jgi:hypothetical protein
MNRTRMRPKFVSLSLKNSELHYSARCLYAETLGVDVALVPGVRAALDPLPEWSCTLGWLPPVTPL